MFFNKLKRLKREDVVNSICELESQLGSIEKSISEKEKTINELMKKGRAEKSPEIRLFSAKRIVHLKEEKSAEAKRGMYILYNIKLMNRLKEAIDDKNFVRLTAKSSLGDMLKDQKKLAEFLNKSLNHKIRQEDILTGADEVFNEVRESYVENNDIYGMNASDESLLSMFETQEQDELENGLFQAARSDGEGSTTNEEKNGEE